jgi:hypothetical protein
MSLSWLWPVFLLAVWWAIRLEPEDGGADSGDDDGGIRRLDDRHRHRHPPRSPRPPHRRGPHGGAGGDRFPSPPRVRTVRARARSLGH